MIDRLLERQFVEGLLTRHRVVALVGARQVGKTTLAREVVQRSRQPGTYFDLENPADGRFRWPTESERWR